MTWLTLRQLRMTLTAASLAVAALVLVLAATAPQLFESAQTDPSGFLARLQIDTAERLLYVAGILTLYLAPPLLGAFWGAPLIAREFEAGTHRLVLNQSVTRNRWLATKLIVSLATGLALVALLSLAVTWWASPIDAAVARGDASGPFRAPRAAPLLFGGRGLAPVGYAAFALTLGITLGLVLRRTLAAMAVTLAAVIAVQVAVPLVARAHLSPSTTRDIELSITNVHGLTLPADVAHATASLPMPARISVRGAEPGAWMISQRTVDRTGQVQTDLPGWIGSCVGHPPATPGESVTERPADLAGCLDRLNDLGYRQRVTYLPADRFWSLQWRESALLVTSATLLTAFCFWRIRRDLP